MENRNEQVTHCCLTSHRGGACAAFLPAGVCRLIGFRSAARALGNRRHLPQEYFTSALSGGAAWVANLLTDGTPTTRYPASNRCLDLP